MGSKQFLYHLVVHHSSQRHTKHNANGLRTQALKLNWRITELMVALVVGLINNRNIKTCSIRNEVQIVVQASIKTIAQQ